MAREAIERARSALSAGADPYAHLDHAVATRLGGAMYLVGFLFAAISLPLSPPSGPLGWPGVLACMAAAMACAVTLLRLRGPAAPGLLLFGGYLGLLSSVVFRASAGPGAPFSELLFMTATYTCVVHPARRAFPMLAWTAVASVTPLIYETAGREFAARTVSQLALTLSVGVIVVVWMTRVRRVRGETQAARDRADRLARVDELTGLGNRRALDEALVAAVARARRHGEPLALLVGDLDGFKDINDTCGHQLGDAVLRSAARGMAAALRLEDSCYRWGGD
jgi:hypothetical protein